MTAAAASRAEAASASSSAGRVGVSYRLRRLYDDRHIWSNTRAAVSGYGNVGMPARLRIASPAATAAPPIQLANTGLPSTFAYGRSASAVPVGSVIACGLRI